MKVLLAALNAKYLHSSLAIRDLKAYCDKLCTIQVMDFTINEELQSNIADIYYAQPDVIGFSCYIWNIERTLKLAAVLKKALPGVVIIFGGPEVSFNSQEYIAKYAFIDAIICGEGEATLKEYLEAVINNQSIDNILGLTFRKAGEPHLNPGRISQPALDCIPFPYSREDLKALENKLIYYESSRGCAFGCTYCLSGTDKHVRYLSPERVEQDIKFFIDSGVKQVKFVDRTFNLNKKHALKVWDIILQHANQDVNFHFEISADLLDEEALDFLASVPQGLFQFEIGVQSTNGPTLELINRKSDLIKIKNNVKLLLANNNIHLHLDLIAGLPLEDLATFANSFNEVYDLRAHQLQLGFLKILPGTNIWKNTEAYGIDSATFPPYEVIQTSTLSIAELLQLKEIEKIVENYYNSNLFIYILKYVKSKMVQDAFNFYHEFAQFILVRNLKESSLINRAKYIFDFISGCWPEDKTQQQKTLVLDLLSNQKTLSMPDWLDFDKEAIKKFTSNKLSDEAFLKTFTTDTYANLRFLQKNIIIFPLDSEMMQLLANRAGEGMVIFDYTKSDKLTGRVSTWFIQC